MSQIVEILIAKSPTEPVVQVPSVRALPGVGLEGDRYARGVGTFSRQPQRPDGELTLVQLEHIQEFASTSGLRFSTQDARRNLVTIGVDLNALVGREFRVGEVRIRGVRLCEPCNYLAKKTWPEVLRALVHKGGLRAQILSGGLIKVGDELIVENCSAGDGHTRIHYHPIQSDGTLPAFAPPLPQVALDVMNSFPRMYQGNGYVPPWIGYIATDDAVPIGTCAFKTPPSNGRVEIAYFTFPEYEGRGYAKTMARYLLEIAKKTDPRVLIVAQTLPHESASTTVLRRLNFKCVGTVKHPEDGDVWEWHL